MARKALALRLHHALNVFVGGVWLLVAIESFSSTRIPVADYGVFPGLVATFFVVPLGLFAIWIARRRSRTIPTIGERAYGIASRVFWCLSWLASCLPILFLLALLQPWPLSLLYGPDTEYARGEFGRLYGDEPPESVSAIHYQWRGLRDGTTFMRFETAELEVVERLAARLRLIRTDEPGPVVLEPEDWRPPWWIEIEPNSEWTGRDGRERLWYDARRGAALYMSITF